MFYIYGRIQSWLEFPLVQMTKENHMNREKLMLVALIGKGGEVAIENVHSIYCVGSSKTLGSLN